MTDDILALIRDNKKSHLYLPRVLFSDEAQSYLERGIFVPTNQWYREIDCPNGCGALAPVRKTGPGRYIAVCTHGAVTEEIEVAADEVELCEFDPVAFKHEATPEEKAMLSGGNRNANLDSLPPGTMLIQKAEEPLDVALCAEILGYSVRQFQRLEKNAEWCKKTGYPGRYVTLDSFRAWGTPIGQNRKLGKASRARQKDRQWGSGKKRRDEYD